MKMVPDEPTEEMVDAGARAAWAEYCKTNGPLTLRKYASDDIMEQNHEYARTTIRAAIAAAPSQPEQPDRAAKGSSCQQELREQGRAYPRTCQICGLGPCQRTRPTEQPEQAVAWMGRIGDDWRVIHRDEMAKQPSDVQELWKSAQPLYARPALTDEQIREIAEKLQVHLTGMLVASCNCDTKTPDVEHHEKRCHYRKTSEAVEIIDNLCKAITEALRGRG